MVFELKLSYTYINLLAKLHFLPSLERELAQCRQAGVARDNEELELGVRCMAAGIYDDQNKLVAGLSISAPADRIDENWVPRLRATASEISSALGFRGNETTR